MKATETATPDARSERRQVFDALLAHARDSGGAALVEGDANDRATITALAPTSGDLAQALAQWLRESFARVSEVETAQGLPASAAVLARAGATWLSAWPGDSRDAPREYLVLLGTVGQAPADDGTIAALARAAGLLAVSGAQRPLEARALDHAASGVSIADATAPDMPLIHVNDEFIAMTGYGRDEVIGRNCRFLQGASRDEQAVAEIRAGLREQRPSRVRLRNWRKNGEPFWNELHIAPLLDDAGRVTHFVGVQLDVTESVSLAERLTRERQAFQQVLECASNGMVVISEAGEIRFANASAERMLGDPGADLAGETFDMPLSANAPTEVSIRRAEHRRSAPGVAELNVTHSEWYGEPVWIATLNDVTARRHAEEKARRMAYTDTLTGLANRDQLREHLDQALLRAQREDRHVALLMLDMDRFKEINDTLGHAVGDTFLVEVAHRLTRTLRDTDLVARFGGDEFAILLEGAPAREGAAAVGDKIIRAFDEPLTLDSRSITAACSVGISVFPDDADNAVAIMQHADAAMYQAKSSGGSVSCLYHHSLTERAERRLELDQSLTSAVAQDQFVVHYQKQVRLADTGRIGLEALVRWQHPERGLVGPDEFIEHLEDLGLIGELTRYVLERICQDLVAWGDGLPPDVPVALNLSARELRDTDLAPTLAGIIHRHGVDPSRITFELTESAAATDIVQAMHTLGELRAYGAQVALDDFGKGFSALNYLRVLPIDTVKIDRDFAIDLPHDEASAALVRAIVEMAHGVGKRVVAEGVEL
ncbi:MAG: hypothetical protein BRD57_00160, partial [Proteobacteria bacterium SW_6_67_9]